MRSGLIISLVFISLSNILRASDHLNYLNAQIIGQTVVLNFEMRTGAICFGIQIERRDAEINFQQIGLARSRNLWE